MIIRRKRLALAVMIIQILVSGCTASPKDPLTRTEFLLGTVCSITLYDKRSEKIMDKAFSRIVELEGKVSANGNGTEVYEINEKAGREKVKVSEDTFTLIKKGLEYGALSKGNFDISIGPLTQLWHIGFDDARVPAQNEIDDVLPLIHYQDIEINEEEQTVFLKKPNMKLDLGGIAKGFIADETAKVLRENGVTSAIIDLGGNIFVLGEKNGSSWTVGIQDPFNKRNSIVGVIRFTDKSVVTSGMYERYIEKDSTLYHHILNPFDGYPYQNHIAGATIISDSSMDGDALSTTVFSLDLSEGMQFIESLQEIEAIFITFDKKVYLSSGLKDAFVLTNQEYSTEDTE